MRRAWQHKLMPHEPADYDPDVVYAVNALATGTANEGQQKLVWDWLMYVGADDDWAYRPESAGPGARDVVLGKQYVSRQFRKMRSPEIIDWARREREKEALKARTAPSDKPLPPLARRRKHT